MSKKEMAKQLWTVVHPDKGMLVVCPECKTVPQTYLQKHCSNCGTKLAWKNIYIIDTRKNEEENENSEHENNQENIPEN